MARLLPVLRDWGRKRKIYDPKAALEALLNKRLLSPTEIAAMFEVDARVVRLWIDLFGIPSRVMEPEISRAVKGLKFTDLGVYFSARAAASYKDMAAELGVSHSTVSTYYDLWVQETATARSVQSESKKPVKSKKK